MLPKRPLFTLMPDGPGGGTDLPESILPPRQGEVEIGSNELEDGEYEVVVDGTPEADAMKAASMDVPDNLKGKSRDEILQALLEERKKLAGEQKPEPVSELTSTMREMLSKLAPPKQEVQPGYSLTPQTPLSREAQLPEQEFSKYIANLMLEDPVRAQQLVMERQMAPLLTTVASSQAQLSRELALSNPAYKKVYDKYSNEVEQMVAAVPVQTRLQNPKIYHQAIELVKARHVDEVVNEELESKLQSMLEEKLKEYGISPGAKPQQPSQGYVPPSTAARPASEGQKRTVVVPKWVADEAKIKGLDPLFLYNHYKTKGAL
jgi:hypothetical protein